jgi:hypothetical protein
MRLADCTYYLMYNMYILYIIIYLTIGCIPTYVSRVWLFFW